MKQGTSFTTEHPQDLDKPSHTLMNSFSLTNSPELAALEPTLRIPSDSLRASLGVGGGQRGEGGACPLRRLSVLALAPVFVSPRQCAVQPLPRLLARQRGKEKWR